MDGVKTAIVGFIFVCIVLPHIIKNRHQYYMALVIVLLGMFLQVLANMFSDSTGKFYKFCYTFDLLFDILAIILLVLAAGGLGWRELAGNIAGAIEVMRRGETEKTVIIPLSKQDDRPRYDQDTRPDDEPTQYALDDADEAGGYPLKKTPPATVAADAGAPEPKADRPAGQE